MDQVQDAAATPTADNAGFEWMVVEIFGHRRHAGRAREEERFGAKMLRIDVPTVQRMDGAAGGTTGTQLIITEWVTHYYGGSAIFSLTMTDEASALRANERWAPAPARLSHIEEEDVDVVGF